MASADTSSEQEYHLGWSETKACHYEKSTLVVYRTHYEGFVGKLAVSYSRHGVNLEPSVDMVVATTRVSPCCLLRIIFKYGFITYHIVPKPLLANSPDLARSDAED